jgi:hypothetical protein
MDLHLRKSTTTDEQLARMMSYMLRYGRKLPSQSPGKGLPVSHGC